MFKILFSLFLATAIVAPAAAQTQIDALRNRARELRQEFQEQREEVQETFRQQAEEVREEFRTEVKTLRGELKEKFEENRAKAQAELKRRREELRARFESERLETKERLETARAELKARLEQIKNERKTRIVERLSERMNALNEKMTNHFLEVLDKMDKILDNVASRTDKAEAHSLDVSTVRAAITEAESAIAAARGATETQAGKVYSFDITSEENLRLDVGKARQALHEDLNAVRKTIRAAHDAIRNAAVTLAQIPRVDELEVDAGES